MHLYSIFRHASITLPHWVIRFSVDTDRDAEINNINQVIEFPIVSLGGVKAVKLDLAFPLKSGVVRWSTCMPFHCDTSRATCHIRICAKNHDICCFMATVKCLKRDQYRVIPCQINNFQYIDLWIQSE